MEVPNRRQCEGGTAFSRVRTNQPMGHRLLALMRNRCKPVGRATGPQPLQKDLCGIKRTNSAVPGPGQHTDRFGVVWLQHLSLSLSLSLIWKVASPVVDWWPTNANGSRGFEERTDRGAKRQTAVAASLQCPQRQQKVQQSPVGRCSCVLVFASRKATNKTFAGSERNRPAPLTDLRANPPSSGRERNVRLVACCLKQQAPSHRTVCVCGPPNA